MFTRWDKANSELQAYEQAINFYVDGSGKTDEYAAYNCEKFIQAVVRLRAEIESIVEQAEPYYRMYKLNLVRVNEIRLARDKKERYE